MAVRRRLHWSGLLLIAALVLAWEQPARAQQSPPPPGEAIQLPGVFTTDRVKEALLQRFGKGGLPPDFPPELLQLLKDRVERQRMKKLNEKEMEAAREMLRRNPGIRKELEEIGKKIRNGKASLTQEERKRLEQLLPKEGMPPGPIPVPVPPNGNGPPMPVAPPEPKMNLDQPPAPNGGPEANPPKQDQGASRDASLFDRNEGPREKATRAAASLWERNIGPLDESPAVKRALFELVEGTADIKDGAGNSFWDTLSKEAGESKSLFDFLDGAAAGESWTKPNFDFDFSFGKWGGSEAGFDAGGDSGRENWWQRNFGGRRETPPSSSRDSLRSSSAGSGGFDIGIPGLEGTIWPVVILAAIVCGSFVAWRLWRMKRAAEAQLHLGGLGWPIDPRRITTREHVVLAFEYLSVMICGPHAKTWTHNTIAEALMGLASTHGETALMLARLYELARYAPLDEPLTTGELSEARRLICALAGLEHE